MGEGKGGQPLMKSLGAFSIVRCVKRTGPALALSVVLFLSSNPLTGRAAETPSPARQPVAAAINTTPGRPRFNRAFVVDNRLSALRRDPDEGSPILHRLHLAHQVFVIESNSGRQPLYRRVAISRRTRGWLHRAAIVVPSHAGD